MPYCSFCGKLCATSAGLERHIARTPRCKKSSGEKFGQYATSIWDDVPANLDNVQVEPLEDLPELPELPEFPDFYLEDNIQIAEDMVNDEENNLPPQDPPLPQDGPQPHSQPERSTVDVEAGRYIEYMPKEYLAGATWGNCKPLFQSLDEERKRLGGNRWAPFEDEDEWELAEWLIRNVGQTQTDSFLKLPIVS